MKIRLLALVVLAACVQPPPPPPQVTPPPPESFLATLTVAAERVPVHAEPSRSGAEVASLRLGERLRLIERQGEWLLVRTESEVRGYVEAAALVAPTCTVDRPEPVIVEEPLFRFHENPPHGSVVIEAEYSANARLVNTRVLLNTTGDPALEQQAIEDLRGLRFLSPTEQCRPRPFFYTFTRRF